jgi:senataxin
LLIKSPRLLVLAPSNGAVDNVIEKILSKGFIDGNGDTYWPSMLRLGSGSKRSKVKVLSLEDTTEHILSIDKSEVQALRESVSEDIKLLVQNIFNVQTLLLHLKEAWMTYELPEDVELRVDSATTMPYWVDHKNRTNLSCPPALRTVDSKRSSLPFELVPEYIIYTTHLASLLDQLKHQSLQYKRLVLRNQYAGRQQSYKSLVETSLIDDAHIVFTTLNSSGHSSLDASPFDAIIVDEAAQCIEPSLLIPLRLPCSRCLLVGDPMQLPATIFSNTCKSIGFDTSLFERLQNNHHQVLLLNTQYRMVPEISAFPSKMFYQGKLLNGVDLNSCYPPYIRNQHSIVTATGTRASHHQAIFPPFLFFDLKSSQDEIKSSLSRLNHQEAVCLINILKVFLLQSMHASPAHIEIGIITPYLEQLNELNRMISRTDWRELGLSRTPDIELNTVDSFQGREKDVIFISCVRANDEGSIGFLSDIRRMNVALTRPKAGLFIVGHADTLRGNKMWSRLIDHAEDSNSLVSLYRADEDIEAVLQNIAIEDSWESDSSIAMVEVRPVKRIKIEPEEGEVVE